MFTHAIGQFTDPSGIQHTSTEKDSFVLADGWIIAFEGTNARPDLGLWKAIDCKNAIGEALSLKEPKPMFCEVDDQRLNFFFANPKAVFMCGTDEAHEVLMTPSVNGKYWGWIDAQLGDIGIVFEYEQSFRTCFPYKLETMISAGKGLIVKLDAQLTGKTVHNTGASWK